MKYYSIKDNQNTSFMEDTFDKPMTLKALKKRFWSLDDSRTKEYKNFTKEYIEMMWEVEFLEVLKEKKFCRRCGSELFKSPVKDYNFYCMECDEDFYNFEIN